jgi:hypothetical protein
MSSFGQQQVIRIVTAWREISFGELWRPYA